MIITIYTPQKFNIATEKWWLEECFGHFSGENSLLNFRAGMLSNTKKVRIPVNKTWKGSMAIDTASSLGSWLISVSSERWIPNQTSGACSVPGTLPPTAAWQGHGNSHCFPYGRDGHQPHNRGFVGPHYKDSPLKVGWVYPRCKEFRPWHIWKIVWVQPSAVSIDVNMWFIKYIIFRG